ncbi:MAG: hypothetical protein ACK5EA_09290 [Planctomycetaceae bacterium]
MAFEFLLWDLEDDPEGNVVHCAAHGVTPEEIEQVFENVDGVDMSRTSGRPVVFGHTQTGRYLMVVFEIVDPNMAYPITAYDVPEKVSR